MKCSLSISDFLEELSVAAAAAKSPQSCPTLCNPMDCSLPGSSIHGIFQARVLGWKSSLVFPILLFSSISLHWSLRKSFLSLLAILCNSVFRWMYLSFTLLPLACLLFSAICKASSDNRVASFRLFFLVIVLITASCTVSRTSVHSSSDTLTISNPLNLFVTSTVNICFGGKNIMRMASVDYCLS